METATRSAVRRPELVTDVPIAAPTEPVRVLTVTATYLLSEAGRKASLLAGGDGRAQQQRSLQVPTTRLHLVTVDNDGKARLKLRPRFQLDEQQRVVRVDAPPAYDDPPTIDDLFREAARNHELERAFGAERTAARSKRRETDRELRDQLAQSFLSDRTQRALVHPAPSPKRCFLSTEHGRILFDVGHDDGPAKEVPAEAHRRFRADLVARKQQNHQTRAEQLALHEEKKRVIAEWIGANGTPEQQARQAAGVLPMDEAIEAITDHAFLAIGDQQRYERDGVERLQAHVRRFPQHADTVLVANDLAVSGTDAVKATAAQWALVKELHLARPQATVTLRRHTIAWKGHSAVPPLVLYGVLIAERSGPFVLRREYAAPDA